MNEEKLKRLQDINQLIELIAKTDRCFFNSKNGVGQMVPLKTTVRWKDGYTQKIMPIFEDRKMRDFSSGGSMQMLVTCFKRYILTGVPYSKGCLYSTSWGYTISGQSQIIEFAKEIGYVSNSLTFEEYLISLYGTENEWVLSYMKDQVEVELIHNNS